MSQDIVKLFEKEGGEFISPPSVFTEKLKKIRVVLFDWDGVFNDGFKNGTEGSIFSEVDAMGTNMLRYAFWRANSVLPVSVIMTGEANPSSQHFAKRENFHAVYSKTKNKGEAFTKMCETFKCQPSEVLFFFDDVLDMEVARLCGGRIMIGTGAKVMLNQFARENKFADYITRHDGGHHGLREGAELVIGLLGQFTDVVGNRMVMSESYRSYLADRKKIEMIHTEA